MEPPPVVTQAPEARPLAERVRDGWESRVEPTLAKYVPRVEALAVMAIAAGIVLRVATPFTMDLRSDGNTYSAMGHALATHGSFLMPYGDVTTWAPHPPTSSHHYPPLYPAFLAVVYKLFGWGLWQTKAAAVVASLVVLPVVYYLTRDLYGSRTALLATGLVAAEPHLVWVTGTGFSENLVLVFFAFTMWAILRGLDQPKLIVVAGLAAGLAYLTRASVGYFFVIAGLGGFLWRFHYMGWDVLKNRWYLAAIGVFGAIVFAWAMRNFLLFGWKTYTLFDTGYYLRLPDWQTSSYTDYVSNYAAARSATWAYALREKLPLFAFYLLAYTLPFAPEAWRSLKRIREEKESALWLSVFLVFVIAWVITSMFWVYEQSDIYWMDNHRYVTIAYLPLAWILFKSARQRRGGFRARYLVLVVGLLAVSGYAHVKPVQFADIRAAEALDGDLREGDEVAVAGNTIKYAFYAYLMDPQAITVYGWQEGTTESPDFIVSLKHWETYPGYTLKDTHVTHYLNGDTMTARTWVRNDRVT